MAKATFIVEVAYNTRKTDPEALASALDTLMETALSTPGIMDDYGDIGVGEFLMHSRHTCNFGKPRRKKTATCEDCGKQWPVHKLNPVKHLTERVAPGEPMPAGECPHCGAVCH